MDPMEITYFYHPKLNKPRMVAAWPGMGFLAKIGADYLRRQVNAKKFAEIKYYHNLLVYKNGLAKLAPIKHSFYASEEHNLVICVGDAQPASPEESIRLAEKVAELAKELGVEVIYTMAAYPNEYDGSPSIYGVFTDEESREELERLNVKVLTEEGAINGLNGTMIGVARSLGIKGVCLLGDINYANVPQHLASKAVLGVLSNLLEVEIDTKQLEVRAKKIDASIKKRLELFQEEAQPLEEKRLGYIS